MSKQISLYVQIDVDLADHYKLTRLTKKLSEDVRRTSKDVQGRCPDVSQLSETTIGMLFRLWSWGLRFSSDDGRIDKLTDEEIATIMNYPGDPGFLVKALIETEFVSDDGELSGWDEMYGGLAARRASDRERKRNERAAKKESVRRTSADSPRTSSVEKRRVEKSREPNGSVKFEDGI